MRILLLHRAYVRRCRICGAEWEVTRAQARSLRRMARPVGSRGNAGRYGGLGAPTQTVQGVRASVGAYDQTVEAWEGYRRCPSCGIDDFSQHPKTHSE